jgi:hypothetical protein
MKKIFAAAALLALPVGVFAQAAQFEPVWERWYGGTGDNAVPTWFGSIGDNPDLTRGGDVNLASTEASGKSVIITSRGGALAVHVLSYDDGAELRTMDVTAPLAGPGLFKVNIIKTGQDGAVYGIGLNGTAAAAPAVVWRWADDASATEPVLISDQGVDNPFRTGDSAALIESGSNIALYTTGNNAASRTSAVISTDGGASWTTTIVGPTRAGFSMAVDEIGGNLFLKQGNANLFEYDMAGTEVREWGPALIPDLLTDQVAVRQLFVAGGVEHLVFQTYREAGTSTFELSQVAAIDRVAGSGEIVFEIPTTKDQINSNNANGSGNVQLFVDEGALRAFVLTTNNSFGIYELPADTSVSDWQLL